MSGLPVVDAGVETGATCTSAAVVAGFEDYGALPDVPHAQRDAAAFAAFVRSTLGCDPVVLGDDTDREGLRSAVAAAGRAPGVRTVWVYFAGNAASPVRPVLLAPDTPADPGAFEAHGLALDDVHSLATAGGADLVLIVDAALDGRSRTGAELVPGRRFLQARPEPLDPGSVTWWAVAQGEVAGDLPSVEHGAFTWAVLGALRGWADGVRGRPDTRVSADEADRWVTDTLADLGVDQHPVLRGDRLRLLSLAHEAQPPLDPLRWTPSEPQSSAVVGPPPTGTVTVAMAIGGVAYVDGVRQVPADGVATVAVRPGRHLVEVRTPEGISMTALHVDVDEGQQVDLVYRNRQLFLTP